MKTEMKIYAALAVLAVLGMGLYLTQKSKAKEWSAHSAVAASADLPAVALPKDDAEKVTKVELTYDSKAGDKSEKKSVTLEKKGDAWEVVKPVAAKANGSNVKSLIDNLKDLKVKEVIERNAASYPQYDLTDDKAVHVVAYKGDAKAVDLYFGKSGSRGQMVRVAGKDGVYVASGYSSYLYTRELKNWRETSMLKFEDENVVSADVTNKNGAFSFSKNGDKWSGSYAKRDKDGKLADPAKKWEKFDEAKVKDMLRAYKSLSAEDFAEAGADTGLDDAAKEGGVVHIKLKDNAGDFTVKVGKVQKGTSRFAVKDGDPTVVVLSSWTADWATGDKTKFEKSDKDKDKKDAPPPAMPAGMPGGMPGMEE
jgi:archaellin